MPGKRKHWRIPMDGFHPSWVPMNWGFVFFRLGFPGGSEVFSGYPRSSGMSLVFSRQYSFKNGVKYHGSYHPISFWVMFIRFLGV
jgi:hypothetical protein